MKKRGRSRKRPVASSAVRPYFTAGTRSASIAVEALHAPTHVVVLQSDAPEEENSWDRDATGRHGLFRDVIGMLSRPVD